MKNAHNRLFVRAVSYVFIANGDAGRAGDNASSLST